MAGIGSFAFGQLNSWQQMQVWSEKRRAQQQELIDRNQALVDQMTSMFSSNISDEENLIANQIRTRLQAESDAAAEKTAKSLGSLFDSSI